MQSNYAFLFQKFLYDVKMKTEERIIGSNLKKYRLEENKAVNNLEIRINLNSFLSLYDYKKVESSQAMLQQCINPHLRINSTCY